jgi:hypothetical protein
VEEASTCLNILFVNGQHNQIKVFLDYFELFLYANVKNNEKHLKNH